MCSENKGADQLCGSDLRLCFRICKKPVFLQCSSNRGKMTGSPSNDADQLGLLRV